MSDLWPLGPFPPGLPAEGADLAAALAADVFCAAAVAGPVRAALAKQLDAVLGQGDLVAAAAVVSALVDTWPCASLVDTALAGRRPVDLAVLARVSEIVRLAFGWERMGHTVWPLPPAAWIQHHAGTGPHRLHRRGLDDGADAVAQALGLQVGPATAPESVLVVPADELVQRREACAARLAREALRATAIVGELDGSAATGLALGELRMESSHQETWERYGTAGLEEPILASWTRALCAPERGSGSGPLRARCLGVVLPGPVEALRAGRAERAGWLLWDGPHAPRAVTPRAAAVVVLLARGATPTQIAESLGVEATEVRAALGALRDLGAVDGGDLD